MPVEKIDEFAKNGQKSTEGIILENGFPQEQKPLRQWFNYLLNNQAVKTNQVIDEINRLDADVIDLAVTKYDTGVEVTSKGEGQVVRTQASKNADIVSLLDFGAPYNTDSTNHLQAALNYLDSRGGGTLYIPYHTGVLVISGIVDLKPNVTVVCDKNLEVDCMALTSGIQFRAYGSVSAEIPLSANKTSGDTLISTVTSHGLSVGDDVLIISQRECAHADAGELWRLGETTANSASPFFAEPLVVSAVNSPNSFTSTSPLIFPDYRTDKSLETSEFARDTSTILKINAFKNFSWYGGTFKKDSGSLFRTTWGKDCHIQVKFERGYGTGQEVYFLNSINCTTKCEVNRPVDWVLESDHSGYNSIKDVSSWYSYVDLFERNGSQGLDQTYSNYSGIGGTYKVRHINSHEDGMTTHGCIYKATVDIYAVNAKSTAFRNRARFCEGNLTAINCASGMRNSTYGILDSEIRVDLQNCYSQGIAMLDEGVVVISPAVKNTTYSGSIVMTANSTGRAIEIEPNLDTNNKYADSGITLRDMYIRSYSGAIKSDSYINGVNIKNVKIDHYGLSSPVYLRQGAGHNISGLHVIMHTTDGSVPAILASPLSGGNTDFIAYGSPALSIDYKTCKVTNGTLITDDDRLISNKYTLSGTSTTISSVTLTNKNVSDLVKINITSGTSSFNRIVLDTKLSIGREFTVLVNTTNSGTTSFGVYAISPNTIIFLDGVNDGGGSFLNITNSRQFRVRKISATEFVVSR